MMMKSKRAKNTQSNICENSFNGISVHAALEVFQTLYLSRLPSDLIVKWKLNNSSINFSEISPAENCYFNCEACFYR